MIYDGKTCQKMSYHDFFKLPLRSMNLWEIESHLDALPKEERGLIMSSVNKLLK